MSGSDNYDLPKSLEDGVPQHHASLPPPPPIILPNPQVLKKSLRSLKPYWQARSMCAHILEIKSHIDKPGELGVKVS